MKINLEARLYVPTMMQWIGGSNPAIATFAGEYELVIATPNDLGRLFQRQHRFCGCDFRIVTYREDENRLILTSEIPAKTFVDIDAFLEAHIAHKDGWKIDQKELECYRKNQR